MNVNNQLGFLWKKNLDLPHCGAGGDKGGVTSLLRNPLM